MSREKVEFHIGRGETVTMVADCRRIGTETGPSGSANLEIYDVTIGGVVCRGTWNNDARNLTQVYGPPKALHQILRNKASAART